MFLITYVVEISASWETVNHPLFWNGNQISSDICLYASDANNTYDAWLMISLPIIAKDTLLQISFKQIESTLT